MVFSAHGVAPAVRAEAAAARPGRRSTPPARWSPRCTPRPGGSPTTATPSLLIGHAGHEEVEGTLGEAPGGRPCWSRPRPTWPRLQRRRPGQGRLPDADHAGRRRGRARSPRRCASRFPDARGPRSDDICYATTNRQQAVRAIAADSDLVLVVGSANSSNSLRLVEVAERAGTPAHLVDDAGGHRPRLAGRRAHRRHHRRARPRRPQLVDEIVEALAGLGPVDGQRARHRRPRSIRFTLPKEVSGSELGWRCRCARACGIGAYLCSRSWLSRREVPAAGRARAAVRLQPQVRRLRQDPAAARPCSSSGCRSSRPSAAIEECGAPMVSIAGGEPLMHPQIDEIVRQLVASARSSCSCARTRCCCPSSCDKFTAVAVLRLGGAHRRPARAARRVGLQGRRVRPGGRGDQAGQGRGFKVNTNTTVLQHRHPADRHRRARLPQRRPRHRRDADLARPTPTRRRPTRSTSSA